MSRIILLNGVGSAGKSSIARALQNLAADVFLHVQMDSFFAMLPPVCIGRADGFVFETLQQDGKPEIAIRPVAKVCLRSGCASRSGWPPCWRPYVQNRPNPASMLTSPAMMEVLV